MVTDTVTRERKMSRYIDAEAFFKLINTTLPYRELDYPDKAIYNAAISDMCGMLTHFPAADVVEVRHGRWIDVEPAPHNLFYATCSVCGDRQTIEVANYCPMCGASMDEVEE